MDGGVLGADYTTSDNPSALALGDRVLANGLVYEFIGMPRGPPAGGLANELFATNTTDWKPVGGGSVSVSAADDSEITSASSMYA